jgi:hypothetical protein
MLAESAKLRNLEPPSRRQRTESGEQGARDGPLGFGSVSLARAFPLIHFVISSLQFVVVVWDVIAAGELLVYGK